MSDRLPISFDFEVDGVRLEISMSVEAAREVVGWSDSVALLNLGSEALLLQAGLRKIFGPVG